MLLQKSCQRYLLVNYIFQNAKLALNFQITYKRIKITSGGSYFFAKNLKNGLKPCFFVFRKKKKNCTFADN